MSEAGPLCERLDWDSRFFGVSIARANVSRVDGTCLRAVLDWCDAEAIDCLYVLADADDPASARALEESRFMAVDVRVTLELNPIPPVSPPAADARAARLDDIPTLRDIAAVSHHDSRFYNDGHFDGARCDELYRVWIENSCRGWADHVEVVEQDGTAIGYLTVHLRESHTAAIGLIAVDPRYKRQGVGGRMLGGALAWIASQPVRRVTVVTQGRNNQSQGFFQGSGFRPLSREVWYHRWFSRANVER